MVGPEQHTKNLQEGEVKLSELQCEVCGGKLPDLYCTTLVCQVCCEAGNCPCEEWCVVKHTEFKDVPLWLRLEKIRSEKGDEMNGH